MDLFQAIIASVIGSAIVTYLATSIWKKRRFQQKVAAAPTVYVNKLGEVIGKAVEEGRERAIINAKSIVAVRDDFRDSLLSISAQLNTEIDELSNIVSSRGDDSAVGKFKGKATKRYITKGTTGQPSKKLDDASADSEGETEKQTSLAWEMIQVIHNKWPGKKEIIKVELRKMLAELGLHKIA